MREQKDSLLSLGWGCAIPLSSSRNSTRKSCNIPLSSMGLLVQAMVQFHYAFLSFALSSHLKFPNSSPSLSTVPHTYVGVFWGSFLFFWVFQTRLHFTQLNKMRIWPILPKIRLANF